jgi:hypothetical protein
LHSAEIGSLITKEGFQIALGIVTVARSIVVGYLVDIYCAISAHDIIVAAVAEAALHYRQQPILSNIEDTTYRTFGPLSLL